MFAHAIAPHIELRPYHLRDADQMYQVAIANRDHLRPFMAWIEKTRSVEDTRKHIAESLEQAAKGLCLNAGIWEHGRFIGQAGFHDINPYRRSGEIGYWISADAQGRGIITRAVRALISHAFDGLNLHRVEVRCDPTNVRSRAVPERLGFTQEAILRQCLERFDGVMVDAVVYAVLKPEWKP